MWTCGAAIGDDAYVTLKLKELEVKLCGSGTDADKGTLFTIASELAAADPHAAHAAIQYSLQTRVDWVMGVHLPEETRSLAVAVDRTLRACYALCFGADPLDPNGLSESQEDRAFVRDRFALPVWLGGGGFRPAVERALFLNTPSNVAPQFLATEQTRGLWPSLDSVFGAGSFNADNAAARWEAFYVPGSRIALALRSKWGRFQQARKALSPLLASPRRPPKPSSTPARAPLDTRLRSCTGPSSKRSGSTGDWRSTLAPVNSRATTRGDEPSSERRRTGSRSSSSPARRCDTVASPHRSITLQSRTRSGYRRAV